MTQQRTPQEVCVPEKIKVGPFSFFVQACRGRYQKHYRGNIPHLAVDLALVAIIAILGGVVLNTFLFNRAPVLHLIALDVETAPAKLVNGSDARFSITYTNTTDQTMSDVSVVLRLPKDLRAPVITPSSYDTLTNTLTVGALAPRANGSIQVSGALLGDIGAQQRVLAVVSYKNAYGQQRQEFFTHEFALDESAFAASLELPSRITSGSPFAGTVHVQNDTIVDLPSITVQLAGPAGMTVSAASHKPVRDTLYSFDGFAPGAGHSLDFTGVVRAAAESDQELTATVRGTYQGREYILARSSISVPLVFSRLILIAQPADVGASIAPGGSARLRITYQNTESFALKHVRMGVAFSGAYINTDALRAVYPGAQGSIVMIDRPEFAELAPGARGGFDLEISARSSITFTRDDQPQSIDVRPFADYTESTGEARAVHAEGQTLAVAVSSKITLTSAGVFYSPYGDQIGVGPVPPVVDEYTSYYAVIRATNGANTVGNAVVTAQIPSWVEFTHRDSSTLGSHVTVQNGTVTWTIGDLPAYAGIFSAAPELRLEVAITPTKNWIGKPVPLVRDIRFTGVDQRTATRLEASAPDVSTAIFKDEKLNSVVQ